MQSTPCRRALVVANLAGLAALVLPYRLTAHELDDETADRTIFHLAALVPLGLVGFACGSTTGTRWRSPTRGHTTGAPSLHRGRS